MPAPRDTSREAFAVQLERLRQAGPEARVAMAVEMSDVVRELTVAAIRRRQPELDDVQVARALTERLHGTSAVPPSDR